MAKTHAPIMTRREKFPHFITQLHCNCNRRREEVSPQNEANLLVATSSQYILLNLLKYLFRKLQLILLLLLTNNSIAKGIRSAAMCGERRGWCKLSDISDAYLLRYYAIEECFVTNLGRTYWLLVLWCFMLHVAVLEAR